MARSKQTVPFAWMSHPRPAWITPAPFILDDGIPAMSKQSEFAVIVGSNQLFANLGAEALDKIAALCRTQHLTPKEVLFQKGDTG
jgi:hypothetical protein